jgi:hypothetical protein
MFQATRVGGSSAHSFSLKVAGATSYILLPCSQIANPNSHRNAFAGTGSGADASAKLNEDQELVFLTKFKTVSRRVAVSLRSGSGLCSGNHAVSVILDLIVTSVLQATCNTYKRGKMCPFDKCCLFAHGVNELRRCPFELGSSTMCVLLSHVIIMYIRTSTLPNLHGRVASTTPTLLQHLLRHVVPQRTGTILIQLNPPFPSTALSPMRPHHSTTSLNDSAS